MCYPAAMPDVLLIDRDLPAATADEYQIDGAQLAAQDVIETINTSIGSLPWDTDWGSEFPGYLNSNRDPAVIVAELERVAAEHPGVLAQTVRATYFPVPREYYLVFQHESAALPVAVTMPAP